MSITITVGSAQGSEYEILTWFANCVLAAPVATNPNLFAVSNTTDQLLGAPIRLDLTSNANDLTYTNSALTGGTVTGIAVRAANALAPVYTVSGLSISAVDFYNAIVNATNGDTVELETLFFQDTIIFTGNTGEDIFSGGFSADQISGGGGNDVLGGGAGADQLFGEAGIDTVSYDGSQSGVAVTLNGNLAATVGGGDAAGDILIGFENIIGSAGNDVLKGDASANIIEGGLGDDDLDGVAGLDTASYEHATAGVTVSLLFQGAVQDTIGAGKDTLANFENILGSAHADILVGDAKVNVISGGAGDDIVLGGLGADILDGGTDKDTVAYASDQKGVTVTLGENGAQTSVTGNAGSEGIKDKIRNFENIYGGGGADILTGNSLANIIKAGDGADIISGNAGDDDLIGNGGNDILSGGLGNDIIDGGGAGFDT
ncbi:MAG: calcium-binding protein, partial [Pseudorhodoplanes sp.]